MATQRVYSIAVRNHGVRTGWLSSGLLSLVPGMLLWNSHVIAGPETPSQALLSAGGSGSVEIELYKGLMSLNVTRAPWTEVLDEFGRKTGTRFHYVETPQGIITASCNRMTPTRALECLFGHAAAHIVRYAGKHAKSATNPLPSDVWLLGPPGPRDGSSRTNRAVVEPPVSEASCSRANPQQAAGKDPAAEEHDEFDMLMDLSTADDPEARMQALGSLAASAKRNDPSVQAMFRTALTDEDGSVRAQAVYALSKGGGPEAMNVLRSALRDNDASVRLMAVDSAQGDEQSTALLQQALADSDETVRVLAAMKLKDIEYSAGPAR
ncbi:MAG: HEAT repeat domain-containing protein [Gammaproteobacteria bacterium]